MKSSQVLDKIKNLNIPTKCKAELAMLSRRAKKLVLAVIRFIESHRYFGEAMLLGAIVAFLLGKVPIIGGFLALCALVTSAAMGLMRELREDFSRFFECELA